MGVLLSPSAPSQKKRSGQIKHAARPVTLLKKENNNKREISEYFEYNQI